MSAHAHWYGPFSKHHSNESQPPLELVIGISYGLTGGGHVTPGDLTQRRPALDFSQTGVPILFEGDRRRAFFTWMTQERTLRIPKYIRNK
jgi:hypothetical protein